DQREPLPLTDSITPTTDAFGLRDQLLQEQLQPTGHFSQLPDYIIYTTGNGSALHLGWVQTQVTDPYATGNDCWDEDENVATRLFSGFGACPPTGRGLSWAIEAAPEELLNPQSKIVELRVHEGEDLTSEDFTVKYINM